MKRPSSLAIGMVKNPVQQGRSYFDAPSVGEVREHSKTTRTQVADFFNIPVMGPNAQSIGRLIDAKKANEG